MRAHLKIFLNMALVTTGIFFFMPSNANAQGKACCNLDTKEFSSDPLEVCNAKPNHVHIGENGENMAQILPCMQNIQTQASKILQQMGGNTSGFPIGSTSPGAGENQTPTPDDVQDMIGGMQSPTQTSASEYQCCNTDDGQFTGIMSTELCRAKSETHFPDTPEFIGEVQVCRPASSGGGAWNKEDYEDNIENGGMEQWRDKNRPKGFTSYGVPPSAQKKSSIDFQVSYRSNDAHTGQYSLRLKNADIASQLPAQAQAALKFALGGAGALAQRAGVGTCKDPCPIETQQASGNSLGASLKVFGALPSDDVKSHVCGAYKGFIGMSDELVLNITLSSGGRAQGGAQQSFTKSSNDWIEFSLPMTGIVGALPETGDVGIAAQIMPRGSSTSISSGGMPLFGKPVSVLTDVNVDSIHFCDPMGLTAYHPEVIADNTDTEILEKEEDTLGVQTFVNFDNDDEDGQFDMDDDKVEGDNELVRLKMYLPMNSFGKVEFKVENGSDKIALWDDADKSRTFEHANKELEVEELLRATADGSKFERNVWVEAIKPSARQGDVEFVFIFKNKLQGGAETEDKVVLTALGIESIRIEGKKNNMDDKNELDDDPNAPAWAKNNVKVLRVFPGKRWDGDKPEQDARNTVNIKVELNVKPTRPVNVAFRSFDMDDPSAFDDEVDDETEAKDNRGEQPNQAGGFPNAGMDTRIVEFTQKSEDFDFQVTMQPGDNFRIVGNGDMASLKRLENNDINLVAENVNLGFMIVDPDVYKKTSKALDAEVREAPNYTSEVLTVWRKLYLEIDNMGPVQDNTLTGQITSFNIKGNTSSGFPKYELGTNLNFFSQLKVKPRQYKTNEGGHIIGWENAYWNGRFTLGGSDYYVWATSGYPGQNDSITISSGKKFGPELGTSIVGQTFTMIDDDITQDGDPMPTLDKQRLEPAFAPAYVLPEILGSAQNKTKIVPFQANFVGDNAIDLRDVYKFDMSDYHEKPDIWVAYLLNAFQGIMQEDRDGLSNRGAIAGQADGRPVTFLNGMGAVIYQESGRELENDYRATSGSNRGQAPPGWRLMDGPPHELGHLFGAQHSEAGLMSDDNAQKTQDFGPETLKRIRSRPHP